MDSANIENGKNPDQTLTFGCPANCSKLWLVVSGAPQEHWRHGWDDNNSNDEQWPYQVQFKNTNLLGKTTGIMTPALCKGPVLINPVVSKSIVYLPENVNWQLINMTGKQILCGYGNSIDLTSFPNSGYFVRYYGRSFKLIKTSSK